MMRTLSSKEEPSRKAKVIVKSQAETQSSLRQPPNTARIPNYKGKPPNRIHDATAEGTIMPAPVQYILIPHHKKLWLEGLRKRKTIGDPHLTVPRSIPRPEMLRVIKDIIANTDTLHKVGHAKKATRITSDAVECLIEECEFKLLKCCHGLVVLVVLARHLLIHYSDRLGRYYDRQLCWALYQHN
jgi:hypothetical protein